MTCSYRIKMSMPSLTANEKRIAEYILTHRREVLTMSSQKLGVCTNTSAAALIRFVQKIGYDGLAAMKIDLAQDTEETDELLNVVIGEDDSLDVLIKKVEKITERTIDITYKLLNTNNLEQALSKLLNAKRIYLVGVGGSGIVCNDFMHKLTRINRDVVFYEDTTILLSRLAHITAEDVVLAVSYTGETQVVNTAVAYAKKAGASVIAITQYNMKSTLAKKADITLFTPVEEREIRLGAISSRNAAFVLTDLLYVAIAKQNLTDTKEALVKTRKLYRTSNEKK